MFDLQSFPPLAGKAASKQEAVKWVDANAVIQHILQNIETGHRREIVLRCDELAYLQAPAEDVNTIFARLLQLILQMKSTLPRLYLHINCKSIAPLQATDPEQRLCSIQFNTNISPCVNWTQLHEKTVAEIAAIVQQNSGRFEVVQGTSQGCIFSVTLPGKPL